MKIKLKQNKAFFPKVNKQFRDDFEELLDRTIQNIQTEAATNLKAVDFGVLRGSITGEIDGLNGSVGTNVRYAPYIEFGTGGLVDVPGGLETYAGKFKGKGVKQVNLPPRPFLFPSARKNVTIMIEELKKLKIDGNK